MKITTLSEPETHAVSTPQADRRLRLLRAFWLATFVLIVLLFLAGIPGYHHPMLVAPTRPNSGEPNPVMPSIPAEAGIPAEGYAFYKLFVNGLLALPPAWVISGRLIALAPVVLLQRLFGSLTGVAQSPLAKDVHA